MHAGGQEFESLHLHQAHNRGVKDFEEIFHNFQSFRRKREKLRLVTVNNQTKLEQGVNAMIFEKSKIPA